MPRLTLVLLDSLLKVTDANLVIFDDQVDLELLDTAGFLVNTSQMCRMPSNLLSDLNELVGAPYKPFDLDGLHVGDELLHVRLVVPRLPAGLVSDEEVVEHEEAKVGKVFMSPADRADPEQKSPESIPKVELGRR